MNAIQWALPGVMLGACMIFSVAGCGGNAKPVGNAGATAKQRPETPADFKDKKNPFAGKDDAIKAGEGLFKAQCVSCHGPQADGNSDAGKALNPPAGNLRAADFQAMSDGYIFWRVTKGGAGANIAGSAMQAFETTLSDEQRWQVIAWLRSLPAK